MSGRLFARHGQAPYVGQQKARPPRPTSTRFQPFAFLALIGGLVAFTGWAVGMVPW